MICDMLWSDPDLVEGFCLSQRGAGYLFGKDPVDKFCEKNGVSVIARAHQLIMEGYKYMFN